MTRRERLERRLARREAWAASRDRRATAAFQRASTIGDAIPLGQPILVGHHSERRHRRDLGRIDAAVAAGAESARMADHHRAKAAGLERHLDRSIFSDDPDALEALDAKIARLAARRDRMKRINRETARGAGWEERLAAAGEPLTADERRELLDIARFAPGATRPSADAPDALPAGIKYPAYALSNLGANIRRLHERRAAIAAARAQSPNPTGGQ